MNSTENQAEIICPHCYSQVNEAANDFQGLEWEEIRVKCTSCKMDFRARKLVYVSYLTDPLRKVDNLKSGATL